MRLTITLPPDATVDIDEGRPIEPAPAWTDPSWAADHTTLMPRVTTTRTMYGEDAAPADLDRTAPLDCLVSANAIAYRARRYVDPFGAEYMPGGGALVAYATQRRYDLDGEEREGWWVQASPDDAGCWYERASEAHARIRSVWTSGDVRVFATYGNAA